MRKRPEGDTVRERQDGAEDEGGQERGRWRLNENRCKQES